MTSRGFNPIEILIVDDSDEDSILMERELTKNKIANHIVAVKSGDEALDYLFCRGQYATRAPDELPRVVFLDLNMPRLSGIETLKIIRADPRTKEIPVVIFTISHDDASIATAYAAGANSYVVKPVSLDQMRIAMQSLGWYWLIVNLTPSGTRSGFMQNGHE